MSQECRDCKHGNVFGGCELEGPCIMTPTPVAPAVKSPIEPDRSYISDWKPKRKVSNFRSEKNAAEPPTPDEFRSIVGRVKPSAPKKKSKQEPQPTQQMYRVRKSGRGMANIIDVNCVAGELVLDPDNALKRSGNVYQVHLRLAGKKKHEHRAYRIVVNDDAIEDLGPLRLLKKRRGKPE